MFRLPILALLLLCCGIGRASCQCSGPCQLANVTVTTNGSDPGEPLFLTPLLDAGEELQARRLSRVPLTDTLHVESYSGFLTVNATLGANHFFWYFPPLRASAAVAPVLLWLQGGPGDSSLFGLFAEHGPLLVRNGSIERRYATWALDHHVVYVDNPVGTGFSFTNDARGYVTDLVQVGQDLYVTLLQFFRLFPELKSNKFFISAESYGGKYAPALVHTIHTRNPDAVPGNRINLVGISIGNGYSDPINQLMYGDYLYQIGLVDNIQKTEILKYETDIKKLITDKKYEKATEQLLELSYLMRKITGFKDLYNIMHECQCEFYSWITILRSNEVRRAIHVGPLLFSDGTLAFKKLEADFTQSVAPWVSEMLSHYRVLLYSGQLDIQVSYSSTENYLMLLNFTGADEYKVAKRKVWRVDQTVAGYVKRAGNLTEVLLRKAGHMVPLDQPRWALHLITRFTYNLPFQ